MLGTSLIAYWPSWEVSGSALTDISGNGRNGNYGGVYTLNSEVSPIKKPAPSYLGTAYAQIWSAALAAAFPYASGSIGGFCKVDNVSRFADSTARIVAEFSAGTNDRNDIKIYKTPVANTFQVLTHTAGVAKYVSFVVNPTTAWFSWLLTWNIAGNRLNAYYNYTDKGAATGNFGTGWESNITVDRTLLGSLNGGIQMWFGSISDVFVASVELSQAQVSSLRVSGINKMVVLGDSLSAGTSWIEAFNTAFNGGSNGVQNRSVAANTIFDHMATQAAAAANDDANIIICMLGTNDTIVDDTLRAKYQASLATLQASNSRARIYGVGIFDRTDMTGVIEKNGRIQTACNNVGVTYKDPTGVITPATDTTDGTHWTTGGKTKVSDWVLTWAQ